jgi:hypothetical protein
MPLYTIKRVFACFYGAPETIRTSDSHALNH